MLSLFDFLVKMCYVLNNLKGYEYNLEIYENPYKIKGFLKEKLPDGSLQYSLEILEKDKQFSIDYWEEKGEKGEYHYIINENSFSGDELEDLIQGLGWLDLHIRQTFI